MLNWEDVLLNKTRADYTTIELIIFRENKLQRKRTIRLKKVKKKTKKNKKKTKKKKKKTKNVKP
eukprot:TRINITY_DN16181_c0_g1_i1.p3 TRINITY_DN16181_c0_g1~~TRINITY_DN16181_c0_g1_i1.p3  ORF type:complete len:64 (+),score=0.03 TRINITY_DN16181_c0_g1_i1:406-597(+)